jgi:hypothetical protein
MHDNFILVSVAQRGGLDKDELPATVLVDESEWNDGRGYVTCYDMHTKEPYHNGYKYNKCRFKVMYESQLTASLTPTYNSIKPSYYKAGDFDVIAFCQHHELPFDIGNVVKYVTRAGKKDKDKELEDLNKALEYLQRRIQYINNKA